MNTDASTPPPLYDIILSHSLSHSSSTTTGHEAAFLDSWFGVVVGHLIELHRTFIWQLIKH